MTWPEALRADYKRDRPAPRQRVIDLSRRDELLHERPRRYNFPEASTSATVETLAVWRRLYVPGLFKTVNTQAPSNDPERYRFRVDLEIEAWVSTGTGQVWLRREDPTFPIVGPVVNVTATTPTPISLVLRNVDFIGLPQRFEIRYIAPSGGTVHVRSQSATVDYARFRFTLEV